MEAVNSSIHERLDTYPIEAPADESPRKELTGLLLEPLNHHGTGVFNTNQRTSFI
jgi:hypothetical protein